MMRKLIEQLKREVIPAVGCTEPVALALAASYAARHGEENEIIKGKITAIAAKISSNVYKNAKAVGIPGSDQTGVDMALALGVVIRKPELGLSIFQEVDSQVLQQAKKLLSQIDFQVEILFDQPTIKIEVEVIGEFGGARAVIEGSHNNVTHLNHWDGEKLDRPALCGEGSKKQNFCTSDEADEICSSNQQKADAFSMSDKPEAGNVLKAPQITEDHEAAGTGLRELLEMATKLPVEELQFLLDGVAMNLAIAEKGLALKGGNCIGGAYKSLMKKGLIAQDLPSEMVLYTAAACEARMSGAKEPVMTSCGSGNNGITITVPMAVAGRRLAAPECELAKALAVSHLVNAHIKGHIGKLSPVCGCGVTAGAGVAAGLVHLLGGNIFEMEKAVESVTASLAGMLCDGGKVGCAWKLSAGVNMAFQCAALALEGVCVPVGNGIVGSTTDITLKNLGTICRDGMRGVDAAILNVMM